MDNSFFINKISLKIFQWLVLTPTKCKCWLLEVLSCLVLTPSKPRYWSLGYLSFIFCSSILLLYHFGFVLHHCVFKPKHNVSPIWQLMKKACFKNVHNLHVCFHISTRMLYYYYYYCYFFLSLILLIFSPHFSALCACLPYIFSLTLLWQQKF